MFDIKDHVRGDRKVRFTHANGDGLWYVTDLGFPFPVPFGDVTGATFLPEDRAMLFLRHIRRQADATARESTAA